MHKVIMLVLLIFTVYADYLTAVYQSHVSLTPLGMQYQPRNNLDLIQTITTSRELFCLIACNLKPYCRTIDFDSVSRQCRLFESDLSTGSIIPSSSITSIVGMIRLDPSLFSSIHNQPCQTCEFNRYEVCSTNISICQCPQRSFWTGSMCLPQLYVNQSCSQIDSCRVGLNLTCSMNCYGDFGSCISAANTINPIGITVLGSCNGTTIANTTVLSAPSGIFVANNGTIFVGDGSKTLFSFAPGNRRARALTTYGNWPSYIYADNTSSLVYATITLLHIVRIWPTNTTIPPNGISGTCNLSQLYQPTGITGDSLGNIYVASLGCHWVTKWTWNASNGTLIAGSPTATSGSSSLLLSFPNAIALDEIRSYLYVCDQFNNRVQRFTIGGTPNGVTVAGGNGPGTAANQLYRPFGLYVSHIDGSIYITDLYNNRVQKWLANATVGSTIAGNANGTVGNKANELNQPYSIALDQDEKYFYVSDQINNRLQQFYRN